MKGGEMDQTLDISQVSKMQLAAAVNRQAGAIKQLREQVKTLSEIVVVSLRDPEAVVVGAGGTASIAVAAIQANVQKGMQIRFEKIDNVLCVSVHDKGEASLIEPPRLVIPRS